MNGKIKFNCPRCFHKWSKNYKTQRTDIPANQALYQASKQDVDGRCPRCNSARVEYKESWA